jgi:hypothetical protein
VSAARYSANAAFTFSLSWHFCTPATIFCPAAAMRAPYVCLKAFFCRICLGIDSGKVVRQTDSRAAHAGRKTR